MRIPGIEPGREAWEATIITTRSYPHQQEKNQVIFFIIFYVINNWRNDENQYVRC